MESLSAEQQGLSLAGQVPPGAELTLSRPGIFGETRWEYGSDWLVCRSALHGDVRIARSEVARIRQWPSGSLVVEAGDGKRAISVPPNLPGFPELRDRLMRWQAFDIVPQEDLRLAVAALGAAVIPMCWAGPVIGNGQAGDLLGLLSWAMVILALKIGPAGVLITRPSRAVGCFVRVIALLAAVRVLHLLWP